MKRNKIQVLIVDDEQAQGRALEEAFKRKGYSAVWVNSSVNALTQAQRQEFHCIIVDCLLPKMNGVDLAEEIVGLAVRKPKVILYSGIYKDKKFIKDATDRVKAVSFLNEALRSGRDDRPGRRRLRRRTPTGRRPAPASPRCCR